MQTLPSRPEHQDESLKSRLVLVRSFFPVEWRFDEANTTLTDNETKEKRGFAWFQDDKLYFSPNTKFPVKVPPLPTCEMGTQSRRTQPRILLHGAVVSREIIRVALHGSVGCRTLPVQLRVRGTRRL